MKGALFRTRIRVMFVVPATASGALLGLPDGGAASEVPSLANARFLPRPWR